MYSSLQTVREWVAGTFGMSVSTYPQATDEPPFAVVNRTGGECEYPHDFPRYTIQFWADSDAEGEELALRCARLVRDIPKADDRINGVGVPSITQLGHIEGFGFVWEVSFDLPVNIYEK